MIGFGELSQRPDAKFLEAGAGGGDLGNDVDTFELGARVKDGALAEGLAALAVEAKRVREFGFTAGELDRAKRGSARVLRTRLQRARQERQRRSSPTNTLRHFLERRADSRHRLRVPRSCSGRCRRSRSNDVTTLARVAAVGREPGHPRGDAAEAGLQPPTEADLQAALASGERVAVTPWNDDYRHARAAARIDSRARRGRRRAASFRNSASPSSDVRQRRRSLAQADRLQERSGRLHDVRQGRRVAGGTGRLPAGVARHAVRRRSRASAA